MFVKFEAIWTLKTVPPLIDVASIMSGLIFDRGFRFRERILPTCSTHMRSVQSTLLEPFLSLDFYRDKQVAEIGSKTALFLILTSRHVSCWSLSFLKTWTKPSSQVAKAWNRFKNCSVPHFMELTCIDGWQ